MIGSSIIINRLLNMLIAICIGPFIRHTNATFSLNITACCFNLIRSFLLDCWITICVNNYRFTVSYVIYQLVKVHPSCGIELLGTYCYRFWIENDTNFMFGKIIFTKGVLHEAEALAFWTHVYVVLNTPLYLNYHVVSCQYHIRLFYPYLLRYFRYHVKNVFF